MALMASETNYTDHLIGRADQNPKKYSYRYGTTLSEFRYCAAGLVDKELSGFDGKHRSVLADESVNCGTLRFQNDSL